ncbi:CD276 antigen homolog [Labeo rohita]|uniref:CD276 antigen homolog n=1 Tax=Labeo rohita TaxID=84645 RepID=UPI0021E30538|nr:CD276 antigen homolog [Labeo rohita]
MVIGCCFVCVFAVLINKVCLQVTVEGVIGGSVVLPCFSRKNDLKPQDINVHWRHNYTQIVCDIIQGKDSVEGQNQWYKNRTETFPDEYLKGNFSIKLNNLQHADAGEFSCFITSDSKEETVQLFISAFVVDSTADKGNKSTDLETPGETAPDNVGIPWHWVIIAVVLVIIIIVVLILIFRKKRGQSPL